MEKIVVSVKEIAETVPVSDQPARLEPKLPGPVPWWAKASLAPLVLLLPLLALVTIVLRVAMRGLPPRTRFAWTGFLATLLTISAFVTSILVIVAVSFVPLPSVISGGLPDLDERTTYPGLPMSTTMTAREVSETLKPLVAVISPVQRLWFSRQDRPDGSFGAGALLQANSDGYLFVTARHVVDGFNWNLGGKNEHALVAMATGTWAAAAVVARHKDLDLLLLWVKRESGTSQFAQPVASQKDVSDGEDIFVIGHPEGLRFTLSTGIVSRIEPSMLQMSAPVSPGNSGGPVFDDHGNLVAIVTSMVDKHNDPNAENLNFAVRANALLEDSGWEFPNGMRKRLEDFRASQAGPHQAE